MTITQIKRKHNPHQPVGRWIRPAKRMAIYLRDRFQCLYCGADLHGVTDPRHIQLDHKTPVSKGGSNLEHNVFTTCMRCNCSRGSKPFRSFATTGAKQRAKRQLSLSLKPYLALAKAICSGAVSREQALSEIR
jgi:5-methylcytosine-specific restriction endonuclease McrA